MDDTLKITCGLCVAVFLSLLILGALGLLPKPQPKPPRSPIVLPKAIKVGEAVGKTTGDVSIGFFKGLKKSWKDRDAN